MAYCAKSDIIEVLSVEDLAQLTDDHAGKVTKDARITSAITRADNTINGFLRGKHTVPLSTVPPKVKDWSVTLSIIELYRRRINLQIPETLKDQRDEALKELRMVQKGDFVIDDADSEQNTHGYYISNKTSDSKTFVSNDDQSGLADKFFSAGRITPSGS